MLRGEWPGFEYDGTIRCQNNRGGKLYQRYNLFLKRACGRTGSANVRSRRGPEQLCMLRILRSTYGNESAFISSLLWAKNRTWDVRGSLVRLKDDQMKLKVVTIRVRVKAQLAHE